MSGRRYAGRGADERRAERRAQLLDAGLELIGTRGFAAATIRALCAEARLAPRYFYEQFRDREELLAAVYDAAIAHVLAAVADARRELDAAAPDRVPRLVEAFLRAMTADERRARVCYLEVPGASSALEARRRQAVRAFEVVIAEEAGRFAPSGRDPSFAALALAGATNELLQAWLLGERRPPLAVLARELSVLFTAALSVPAPP